jgi:hypothetical protein
MAKLYWRIKKNGKWTFVAQTEFNTFLGVDAVQINSRRLYMNYQEPVE